ncbi:MAG: PKD domain-containing protein [Planctomycetes bacterium]|nr:PKD domain-containing protein [Planctomycetota bacterium]
MKIFSIKIYSLIFLLILSKTMYAAGWWDADWQYRRQISFERAGQRFAESTGGRVFLNVPGRTFADARDVRVVDENGKVLKSKIVWFDESDRIEIICELGTKESVYVYWGNKNAKKVEKSIIFEPEFGLYLETWEKPEGDFDSWQQTQELFAKSKKIYGRTVHLKVQERFNRFGPSDNYLSHYYGWLECPENGKYKFYTASDDASFLLIDGKMVVQWAGLHTAHSGVYGQHFGTVKLSKGKHRFDYYHVESTADQACVAGWRLPSKINDELEQGETFLIPPRYFGGFVEGVTKKLEIKGQKIVVDFTHIPLSDLYMSESDAIVKLHCTARIHGAKNIVGKYEFEWDFGNGNTGTGSQATHVFLTGGIYEVELKVVANKKTVVSQTIKVKILPIWDQNSRFNENSAKYFYQQIKDYDLSKINTEGLRNFYAVVDMINNEAGKLKALRMIVKHIESFTDYEKPLIYIELAELEAYIAKDLNNCFDALANAQTLSKSSVVLFSLKLKTAELLFKAFEQTNKATELLQELEKNIEKLSVFQKKDLYLTFGDLNRLTGNLEEAKKNYEAFAKAGIQNNAVDDLLMADWRLRIDNYIRLGHSTNAVSLVNDWRKRNPMSYIDSDLAYWEIKTLLADGQISKAQVQAKILIKGQSSNIYVGDCLWELSEYFIKYKVNDKAKEYLTILAKSYKEHPKSSDAEKLLKALK